MTSSPNTASRQATGKSPRKRRKTLVPSQKYEVFTATLTSAATQRELADKYGVDRTTIRTICTVAKQGALDALAAAVPGRRGKTLEQVELDDARIEIDRLKQTVVEQAMRLHLIEGKDEWD